MSSNIFLFNLFATLALKWGFGTVISKNHINSVLFLVVVFLISAGWLILLGVEFLAMSFSLAIVYVGAAAVLFL